MPLPATFYAKVGDQEISISQSVWSGLTKLLDTLPIVDSGLLLIALSCGVIYLLWSGLRTRKQQDIATASLASGLVFVLISFVLIPPSTLTRSTTSGMCFQAWQPS